MDDESRGILTQLLKVAEETRADVKALTARVGTLEARFDALEARFDALETKVDAMGVRLGGEIEQLRHVTSANHFRVIGRIDQVASMLADHMADYHGPLDRKRA
ncbi:MAG: hypothetical protein WCK65_00745 [Rhodospirillaceae bacterium]